MKAISINSGFAALIAAGEKTIECRTWQTSHRGELLICSNRDIVSGTIPRHAICLCNLTNVRPFTRKDLDAACMDGAEYQSGLYAWELEPICSVVPFLVRGMPGVFDVDDTLIRRINEDLMTDEEIDETIEKYFTPLITA